MTANTRATPADTQRRFAEGQLTIRRSVHINAPPARIWQEFETFDRFAAWFGVMVDEHDRFTGAPKKMGHQVITYEPRPGGWIEMEVEVEGVARRFGGKITVFEPASELTFEDRWLPPDAGEPLLITIRLTPSELGGTVVELIQHGFERMGRAGAEEHRGHQAGWTTRQLEALRTMVEAGA
jgi:uncharacterized protein YndB with AHSA1/START domain